MLNTISHFLIDKLVFRMWYFVKADFGTLLLETHQVDRILANLLLIYHSVSKCCRCVEISIDKK